MLFNWPIKQRAYLSSLLFMLWLLQLACHAASFEEDFADDSQPWQEIQIHLPAAPNINDLLPVYVGPVTSYRFGIDPSSLSVDSDGVIRYTLVSTSERGAVNVSYEGIRCSTWEKKLYAFGRSDGSWSRSKRNEWQLIRDNALNRQHAVLAQEIFCDGKQALRNVEQILQRLRGAARIQPNQPIQP